MAGNSENKKCWGEKNMQFDAMNESMQSMGEKPLYISPAITATSRGIEVGRQKRNARQSAPHIKNNPTSLYSSLLSIKNNRLIKWSKDTFTLIKQL